MREYQALDPAWSKVDLGILTGSPLRIAADSILGHAETEARNPTPQPGHLIEQRAPDGAGYLVSTFKGQPSVWMRRFAPNRRYVSAINHKFDS